MTKYTVNEWPNSLIDRALERQKHPGLLRLRLIRVSDDGRQYEPGEVLIAIDTLRKKDNNQGWWITGVTMGSKLLVEVDIDAMTIVATITPLHVA